MDDALARPRRRASMVQPPPRLAQARAIYPAEVAICIRLRSIIHTSQDDLWKTCAALVILVSASSAVAAEERKRKGRQVQCSVLRCRNYEDVNHTDDRREESREAERRFWATMAVRTGGPLAFPIHDRTASRCSGVTSCSQASAGPVEEGRKVERISVSESILDPPI